MASVLLAASIERCFVSRMRDFSEGPRTAETSSRTREICHQDGLRGLDGGLQQEKEEEDKGYCSGEGEGGAAGGGRGSDPNLHPGWRRGSNDPTLPPGWRPKSEDPAATGASAGNAPAAGRGRTVKRKVRRGGGGAGAATASITILNQNVCGWNCKKASFPAIVDKLEPDICTWQETGLTGNNQMKLKGYHPSLRNRKNNKAMGGVCTAVRNNLKPHTVKIKEGADEDEYLVTRLDNVKPALNIVNVYGGQESRMDNQDILESWGGLKSELEEIKERDESVILLGDLNRAIGAGKQGVPDNHQKVSYGGQLVRELLETDEYVLLNSSPQAEGDPWTWVSRANSKVKSFNNLVIVSADLVPYVSSLVVDIRKEYSLYRVRKVKDKMKLIPSDHFPLVIKLKNLLTRLVKREQESTWNLNKPEGWKKFRELQKGVKEKSDSIIADKSLSIEMVDKKLEKIQTKIKFQSFGKTKPMTDTLKKRRMENKRISASRLADEEGQMKEILNKQNEAIEEAINKIKSGKFGRQVSVFKMKEIIGGSKNQSKKLMQCSIQRQERRLCLWKK